MNSQVQYPITYWLKWLSDEHGYRPRVMIDDSDTDIAASSAAYNNSVNGESGSRYNNNVMILVCHWHIMRAWKKNVLAKLLARPSTPNKTLKEKKDMRDNALSLMMYTMKAVTPVDYDLAHEEFQLCCVENDDEWGTTALYLYFERKHHPKRLNWSHAWRSVSILSTIFMSNPHNLHIRITIATSPHQHQQIYRKLASTSQRSVLAEMVQYR